MTASRPIQDAAVLREKLNQAERKIASLEAETKELARSLLEASHDRATIAALRRGNALLERELRELTLRMERYEPVTRVVYGGDRRGGKTMAARMAAAAATAQAPDGFAEMERRTKDVRAAHDARNAPEPSRFSQLEID